MLETKDDADFGCFVELSLKYQDGIRQRNILFIFCRIIKIVDVPSFEKKTRMYKPLEKKFVIALTMENTLTLPQTEILGDNGYGS